MWRHRPLANDQRVRRAVVSWSLVVASDARSDHPDNGHPLEINRSYAVCAECAAGLFPLDEELDLLPGELSVTLAQVVARLGTKLPFEQAAAEVAFFWGIDLDETTVRRYTQAAGAAYVAEQAAELERLERGRPPAPKGPAV